MPGPSDRIGPFIGLARARTFAGRVVSRAVALSA